MVPHRVSAQSATASRRRRPSAAFISYIFCITSITALPLFRVPLQSVLHQNRATMAALQPSRHEVNAARKDLKMPIAKSLGGLGKNEEVAQDVHGTPLQAS